MDKCAWNYDSRMTFFESFKSYHEYRFVKTGITSRAGKITKIICYLLIYNYIIIKDLVF